jgi:hypothetical protein
MGQGMEGLSIMITEMEYITVSFPAASMQKVRLRATG